jgi:hypothetical protein
VEERLADELSIDRADASTAHTRTLVVLRRLGEVRPCRLPFSGEAVHPR